MPWRRLDDFTIDHKGEDCCSMRQIMSIYYKIQKMYIYMYVKYVCTLALINLSYAIIVFIILHHFTKNVQRCMSDLGSCYLS